MKKTSLALLSAFCFTSSYAFDLPKQLIKSYPCDTCSKLSHEKLHAAWPIKADALDTKVSNKRSSRGYKEIVTLEQLRHGLKINVLASEAVIRITPAQNTKLPELELVTPSKQHLKLNEASALYSKDQPLMDQDQSLNPPTVLQLKSELGHGSFILKTNDRTGLASDKFIVNVLDKFSTATLDIKTDAVYYQYGDKVTVTVTLNDSPIIGYLHVYLVSPKGDTMPLRLTEVETDVFVGSTLLKSETNPLGGNWYAEANVIGTVGKGLLKRDGHTAFSYAIPSASLLSVRKLSSNPLTFETTIDVATSSRYALQSVLFYKNHKGQIQPIETSQSANWLEQGKQTLQFSFDNSQKLPEDRLYLGYLHLTDYGQLKSVYAYNQQIAFNQLEE